MQVYEFYELGGSDSAALGTMYVAEPPAGLPLSALLAQVLSRALGCPFTLPLHPLLEVHDAVRLSQLQPLLHPGGLDGWWVRQQGMCQGHRCVQTSSPAIDGCSCYHLAFVAALPVRNIAITPGSTLSVCGACVDGYGSTASAGRHAVRNARWLCQTCMSMASVDQVCTPPRSPPVAVGYQAHVHAETVGLGMCPCAYPAQVAMVRSLRRHYPQVWLAAPCSRATEPSCA